MVLAVGLLACAFQGSRGLWEPDEGFYANPALAMLESGDWWLPRLNGEPFLDKPPLVYWSIAAGMGVLGVGEWGARAGHALWYLGTALVVGLLGARWWGRRTGVLASLVYATSLVPCLAANVLTPDTPLAFCAVLVYYLYWRLEERQSPWARLGWGAALGAALGLGALAKGPAILVLGAPLVVVTLARRRRLGRWLFDRGYLAAGVVFAALALPWYLSMSWRLPGAAAYLFDNQVLGRLATATYARNASTFGGVRVYLPTLLLGAFPWSFVGLKRAAQQVAARRAFLKPSLPSLASRPVALLLATWFFVPLGVFCVARSRLPLYVLPLFAPLSLVFARGLTAEDQPRRPRAAGWIVGWLLVLVAAKGAVGLLPYRWDTRRLAGELGRLGVSPSRLVVLVDAKGNALPVYGFPKVEQVSISEDRYPFYRLSETLADEVEEIATDGEDRALIVSPDDLPVLTDSLRGAGIPFTTRPLRDTPYQLVEVERGGPPDP